MSASGWYKDARVIVVALHTLGVAVVALQIVALLPESPHAGIAWAPCVFLDFPACLVLGLIDPHDVPRALRPARGSYLCPYFEWALIPGVVFAVVGGLQWFGIVSVIRWAVRRRDRSRCRKCGYPLRGLPEPRCPECGTPFDRALLNELRENGK